MAARENSASKVSPTEIASQTNANQNAQSKRCSGVVAKIVKTKQA
ncbi:hypothetical protein ACVXG9_17645 [Escherichia coli]